MNRIIALRKEINDFSGWKRKKRPAVSNGYSQTKAAPALFGIAGLTAVEAAGLGLSGISLLSPAVTKSGNLTIVSDNAERLLTAQAKQKLQGRPKRPYTFPLIWLSGGALASSAAALIEVSWEGNDYGEIGGAYVRRNLTHTTAFTKSSLNVSFNRLNKIPPDQMKDPREWPIVFAYDGTYDPMGNGQFEFQGEFEINAFGGLKFNRHQVKSVSFTDFLIPGKSEDYVKKYSDRNYTVPALPPDQKKYLLEHLGNP
ncbi:hypothetical protein P872_12160 [Rhodonellum psychrophilum GCM71 = DSM 17998]|uniref:Uncharacterized protein n=2 Tax=Rhodonellum TaxID=336827 RepID=U5BW41_9BACT|nr:MULTISPECIES: hypothetical protein [Rhodonellum]ERM80821.1 hypothetical protein P872_12160 [Rhodonellum psychrophilum GCM71 = DSM 17998]MDO9553353.1 hypothetical protein [Rhodonellum sp.]SDZ24057.1 hypothetical protein SAMN05444412_10872 [Rhodonellum ikkaensis]